MLAHVRWIPPPIYNPYKYHKYYKLLMWHWQPLSSAFSSTTCVYIFIINCDHHTFLQLISQKQKRSFLFIMTHCIPFGNNYCNDKLTKERQFYPSIHALSLSQQQNVAKQNVTWTKIFHPFQNNEYAVLTHLARE